MNLKTKTTTAWPLHARFDGPILMIRFGSIGRGTLPLIERHIEPDDEDRRSMKISHPANDDNPQPPPKSPPPAHPKQAGPFRRTLIIAGATAAVVGALTMKIWHPANDDNPQPPPKSPAPIVRDLQGSVFGGPSGISGTGRANFMIGSLPEPDTMTWVTTSKGKRFLANPQAAPRFQGFINELEAAGAPITEIQGYNRRHIAGTKVWSQHAYGNAINIDQLGRNRVKAAFGTWAKTHPDVLRKAARKYGIISGGDWRNPDFGHFEWGGGTGVMSGGDHSSSLVKPVFTTMGQLADKAVQAGRLDPGRRSQLPDPNLTPEQWKAAHPFIYNMVPAEARQQMEAVTARENAAMDAYNKALKAQQNAPQATTPSPNPTGVATPANKNNMADNDNHLPASIRYNNPGAQYPAQWAKLFGMDGYGVIGGGHLIAHFPDPVAGAAANMFLLNKSYVGMTIGAVGTKWTGGNGFGVPGYDANKVLTHDMLIDPAFVIPFMKAIARREAGRNSPLTDDQWNAAFKAFQAGIAAVCPCGPWGVVFCAIGGVVLHEGVQAANGKKAFGH